MRKKYSLDIFQRKVKRYILQKKTILANLETE